MFDFHSRLGKCLLGQWLNFKLFGITYYLVGKIQFKLLFEGPLAKWEWWQACRRRHAAEPQNTCPFYFSKRDLFRFNLSFFWGKFMLLPSGLVFLNFLAWIGWSFFVGGDEFESTDFAPKKSKDPGTLQGTTITYPTFGKGTSSSRVPLKGDMLVPWRVYSFVLQYQRCIFLIWALRMNQKYHAWIPKHLPRSLTTD